MNNNRKFILNALFFLVFLELLLFIGFGWVVFEILAKVLGVGGGLELVVYAILATYSSLFGLFLSWIIYFLTINKIYKRLGADFDFKHPVLYTSIIIFILGNILFYLAMVAWTSFR